MGSTSVCTALYILFMTYNEFFMRKMDLLWPERAKTLMELNKSLQAEIEASQAETGEAPSDGGEGRPSEEGATPNISAILAAKAAANVWRKKTKTYRDKIREETGKDPDDRVGVSISSSYISKSAIRKMRSDALLVEHVLKMREKNGLSSTGDRSTNVASVLSIEGRQRRRGTVLRAPGEQETNSDVFVIHALVLRVCIMHSKTARKKSGKHGIRCRFSCPSFLSDSSRTLWLNGALESVAF